ncbi:MAG: hypothetical protein RLZZ228_875, partial [Actinomycetota bacterium]
HRQRHGSHRPHPAEVVPLEMDRLEMDPDGALRPRDTTRIDSELLAWVVESLWGRPGTVERRGTSTNRGVPRSHPEPSVAQALPV